MPDDQGVNRRQDILNFNDDEQSKQEIDQNNLSERCFLDAHHHCDKFPRPFAFSRPEDYAMVDPRCQIFTLSSIRVLVMMRFE